MEQGYSLLSDKDITEQVHKWRNEVLGAVTKESRETCRRIYIGYLGEMSRRGLKEEKSW